MNLADIPLFDNLVGAYFVEWQEEYGSIAATVDDFAGAVSRDRALAALTEIDRVLTQCDEPDMLVLLREVGYNYDVEPNARGLITEIRNELAARLDATSR